jgi:hypothetical protein
VDLTEEEPVPLITPEQEDQLARTTPMVVVNTKINTKRRQEEELESNKSKARATGERTYSEADRPLKTYYGKKDQDPRQWELPDSAQDQAMSNTPDFTRVLRSATKRAHASVTTDPGKTAQTDDETDAKRVKAMIALLEWFSDEEIDQAEEAAMIAYAAKHDIPIPQSYKEAINDPDYGRQ